MQKITAIIPTFNEEKNIEAAIKSVAWADELLVIDSFSTDRTVDIAKKYATVLQHEYENSAAQKNWSIPQASYSWIFLLDADEVASPGLSAEIRALLSQDHISHDAFEVRRENYFMGQKLRFVWRGDKVIRLFRRDTCRYESLRVHSEIKATGSVGRLKHRIIHNSYHGGLQRHLEKLDTYTTWGAYDRVDQGKKVTILHLLFKPLYRFFKHYFLFLGFLDGQVGFIVSVLSSYTVFLRSLKVWRMQAGESFHSDIQR